MAYIARAFDPVTHAPIGIIEDYDPNANNAINSLGFFGEGGTLRQAFFVDALSDTPFSLVPFFVYAEKITHKETNIQISSALKIPFITALGTPRIRYYLCSRPDQDFYSYVRNDDGDLTRVRHCTLDEMTNSFADFLATEYEFVAESESDALVQKRQRLDRFISTFDTICKIGSYSVVGDDVVHTASDLFFKNQSDSGKRDKYDIVSFVELPFNNINIYNTSMTIQLLSDKILV